MREAIINRRNSILLRNEITSTVTRVGIDISSDLPMYSISDRTGNLIDRNAKYTTIRNVRKSND